MATIVATVRETSGTITYLRPDYPVAGTSALTSFVDDSAGTGSYTKTFRYSKDGVQYSEWISLTNPNLAAITFTDYDILVIELAYDSSTGTGLTVTEATITGTITTPDNGPIFAKSIFARLFDEYDPEVLGWYVNVVQKLYGKGLLAKYIKKQNITNGSSKDFIAYWSAIAKFFAYFVVYARKYQDMFNNIELLGEFLKERGLVVSIHDTLLERQYLARNYYAEMMKRGTIHIIADEHSDEEVFGELLRLIYYVSTDEFLFNLYKAENFGWNTGNSSPLYRGLSWVNESLNKYKTYTGPGAMPYVKVNSHLGYEFTFLYQAPVGSSLKMWVTVKDEDDNPITILSAQDGSSTNIFLDDFYPERYDQDIFYRLIVFPAGTAYSSLDTTNVNNGNNLILTNAARTIQFHLSYDDGGVTEVVDLSFVKFFPLVTDYSRGFVQVKNFISCWLMNNNKDYTLQGLENFIKRYLIPYNAYIKITEIENADGGIEPPPIVVMPTIVKTVSEGPYNVGDIIQYTITIENTGVTDFYGCTIQDIMPVGADYTLFTPAVVSYDTGTRTATWILDILAGTTTTIVIDAILSMTGTITNADYTVTPPGYPVVHGDPLPIEVTVPVTIEKELSPAVGPYIVGNNVTYTITVTNSGGITYTGVKVQDTIDLTKLAFITDTPFQPVDGFGLITWNGLTLPAFGTLIFTVTCKIIDEGEISNEDYFVRLFDSINVVGVPVVFEAEPTEGLELTVILKPAFKAEPTVPGVDPTVAPFLYDITLLPDTDFENFYPLVASPVTPVNKLRKDSYMAHLAPVQQYPTPPYAGNSWRFRPSYMGPVAPLMLYTIPGVGYPNAPGGAGVQRITDSMGHVTFVAPFLMLDPVTNTVLDYLCTKIEVTIESSTPTTATIRMHAVQNTPSHPDYAIIGDPLWFYAAAGAVADPLHPGDPTWALKTLPAGDHYLGVATWFETNPGLKNFPQSQFAMLIRLS